MLALHPTTVMKGKAIVTHHAVTQKLRSAVSDDKLIFGWSPHIDCYVLARLVRARSGAIDYGEVPYVWKVWSDDLGEPLSPYDPRLIDYVKDCDGFRKKSPHEEYHKEDRKAEHLERQRDDSELDDLQYIGRQAFDRVRAAAESMCTAPGRRETREDKWFWQDPDMKAKWEKTHDLSKEKADGRHALGGQAGTEGLLPAAS